MLLPNSLNNYLDYHILDILGHGSKCLDIMGLDLLGLDILGRLRTAGSVLLTSHKHSSARKTTRLNLPRSCCRKVSQLVTLSRKLWMPPALFLALPNHIEDHSTKLYYCNVFVSSSRFHAIYHTWQSSKHATATTVNVCTMTLHSTIMWISLST